MTPSADRAGAVLRGKHAPRSAAARPGKARTHEPAATRRWSVELLLSKARMHELVAIRRLSGELPLTPALRRSACPFPETRYRPASCHQLCVVAQSGGDPSDGGRHLRDAHRSVITTLRSNCSWTIDHHDLSWMKFSCFQTFTNPLATNAGGGAAVPLGGSTEDQLAVWQWPGPRISTSPNEPVGDYPCSGRTTNWERHVSGLTERPPRRSVANLNCAESPSRRAFFWRPVRLHRGW